MVTYFNKKDIVSFGNYLLSEKRKERFKQSFDEAIKNSFNNPISLEEKLSEVHHADVENWIAERKC